MDYNAFCDPAAGGRDQFALAIAHVETRADCSQPIVVLDLCRELTAANPSQVVKEYSELCHRYGITTIGGDRYSGEFVREQFRLNGIEYGVSEKTKSEIYLEFLGLLRSGCVELLDIPKLIAQICALERRTTRSTGRDQIEHPPGGHDDLANAAAGAIVACGVGNSLAVWERLEKTSFNILLGDPIPGDTPPPPAPALIIVPAWDVASQTRTYDPPPDETVRATVKRAFCLILSANTPQLKFEPGINYIPPEILEHPYVQSHIRTQNITLLEDKSTEKPQSA